jgi:Bacterial membrane protein YfhO
LRAGPKVDFLHPSAGVEDRDPYHRPVTFAPSARALCAAPLSCRVSSTIAADPPVVSLQQDAGPSRGNWSKFDAFGLAGVVVAGVLVLVPALAHGTFLGPYDILQSAGLNKTPNVKVNNSTLFDQISLFIPWTNLVWTQVHQGHLPLWNPYSALGMPLAFNWESAPLSLPALIGYLFPVRLAYTAQVVVTVVIAGTGVYVLGKLLRLGMLGCMTAAIVFELSGAFMGNIGWPLASVWSWGGWLFAAIVLVLRGEKRARAIVLLAVVVAFAIYAGNPEDQLLLAFSAAVFASAMLLCRAPALGGSGPVIRPVIDLGLSAIAGAALAAPLILPGLQFARGSNRSVVGPDLFPKGLPPKELVNLIFQGFDGLPLLHSQWFGLSAYEVTSAYVGVIVLVLAATALVVRWRRPEVRSLALVAVATGLLVFAPPLVSFLDSSGARIYWIFAMTPMVLAIAALSGIGMDVLVKSHSEQRVRRVLGIGFGAMAILLGIIWLVARRGLTPSQANIRSHSFIWPTIEVIVGLVVVWMLAKVATRSRTRGAPSAVGAGSIAGSLLLLVVTGFLLASGAPILSSSSHYPTSTPAVTSLKRAVGNSIVGMGVSPAFPSTLGIMVNANLLYNVQEFTAYDPLTPRAYFSLYKTPTSVLDEFVDIFSPAITSAQAARLYGISYVLEPSGDPGPTGSIFDRRVGNEDLYRVPGAAAATLVALRQDGSFPDKFTNGAPVRVAHPNPSAWRMVTQSTTQSVLRLRLSNVPGWHATVDGKPVDVSPFARTMLQVRVPPGRHVVELHYWPKTFSVGVVLALCAVLGLTTLLILARIRSRSPARSEQSPQFPHPAAPAF